MSNNREELKLGQNSLRALISFVSLELCTVEAQNYRRKVGMFLRMKMPFFTCSRFLFINFFGGYKYFDQAIGTRFLSTLEHIRYKNLTKIGRTLRYSEKTQL